MPRAQRHDPLHQQIADDLTRKILEGELVPGQRVPPVRTLVQEWGVSQATAQHAIEVLRSARLVETSNQGTVVAEPRNAIGPQQLMTATRYSAAERIEMRGVGRVQAARQWAYIRPILGLDPGSRVIRREWRTYDSTGPFRLSVSWTDPRYAERVPELLVLEPLPDPRGEAYLIADRYGLTVDWGQESREARQVRDDGREAALLDLPADGHVLAEVYKLGSGEQVLSYTEFITRENRVIVTELAL